VLGTVRGMPKETVDPLPLSKADPDTARLNIWGGVTLASGEGFGGSNGLKPMAGAGANVLEAATTARKHHARRTRWPRLQYRGANNQVCSGSFPIRSSGVRPMRLVSHRTRGVILCRSPIIVYRFPF
jgi:hypothetical protein